MQDTQSHKQAFWFTVINYVAIVIGVVFSLLLYPKDYTFYGEIGYIDSIAQILYPIMVFGGAQALIHFYPTLSIDNKRKLFKFSLRTILILFVVVSVVTLLIAYTSNWDKLKFLYYGLPLAFLLALIELFKRQAANLQKIAIPTFFDKIIPKIGLPIVFVFFYLGYISQNFAFSGFVFLYFFLILLLANYLFKHFSIQTNTGFTSLFDHFSKKEYFAYSFFSLLGSFGSFLAFRVDGIMIPEFLDFEANGAYRNAVNFAAAMSIPATGMFTIYAPQISAYIKNKDWETLQMKYVETGKLMFFIGAIILGCVLVGAEPFFKLLPTSEKLLPILPIIYILGANVLFNMATSFNSEIISYSSYYRFNIYAVLILVVINVLLNYILLTQTSFGNVGVALATLTSLILFNVAKLVFIYKKMALIPFDKNYAILIVVLGVIITIVMLLPSFSNLIEAITKSFLIIFTSTIIVYKLKLIPVATYWISKILKK